MVSVLYPAIAASLRWNGLQLAILEIDPASLTFCAFIRNLQLLSLELSQLPHLLQLQAMAAPLSAPRRRQT